MLAYIRHWQLVFFFFSVTHAEKELNINELNSTVTSDVVNNITKINDLLKDLIHNYETVQTLYKTQESFENEYRRSEENSQPDTTLNLLPLEKKYIRGTTPTPLKTGYVTQMIFYESEERKKIPKINHRSKILNDKSNYKVIGLSDSSSDEKTHIIQTTKQPVMPDLQVSESFFSKGHIEGENDEDLTETKTQLVSQNLAENDTIPKAVSTNSEELNIGNSSEEIIIDFPNERSQRQYNKKSEKRMTIVFAPIGEKSRFGTLIQFNLNKERKNKTTLLDDDVIKTSYTVNVKKEPRKDNKKRNLSVVERKWFEDNNANSKIHKKKKDEKIGVIIITNNKKLQKYTEAAKSESDIEVSEFGSTEEMNDILRSKALRKEYGEACTRVVVRKCYKACTRVLKGTCSSGCKKGLKKKFKELSKTNCIKEFQGVPKATMTDNTTSDTNCTGKKKDHYKPRAMTPDSYLINDNGDFVDLTREGFFETCYPSLQVEAEQHSSKQAGLRNQTILTGNKYMDQINILRDRYERLCQEASASKCKAGCTAAYESACSVYECSKGKKKGFKKNCSKECTAAYRGRDESSRSSSSSSSGSGSGDSDDSDSSISD